MALALVSGVCTAQQVVDVHRCRHAEGGQELDHLTAEGAGECGRQGEPERKAGVTTVRANAWTPGASCAMREPLRRRGADAAPLRVEPWVADVDVALVLRMQWQAGVVLAQVRFADEAVRVRADQRHSGVDAFHPEAPARERTVDVAARQVEHRAHRVRHAITVKGTQVSRSYHSVQSGAHRAGR